MKPVFDSFYRRSMKAGFVHIWCVVVLAASQPLLDILGKNATYFVANQFSSVDIILLVLLLVVVIPGLLGCVYLILSLGSRRISSGWLLLVLGAGGFAITLQIVKKFFPSPSVEGAIVTAVVAAIVSTVFIVAYVRYDAMGSFVGFLIPAIVIVPGYFVMLTPAHDLIFPSVQGTLAAAATSAQVPVVMVMLDEFPLISILDSTAHVNAAEYPHFAELEKSAWWFRNATTNGEGTEWAVPSVLTGKFPDSTKYRLPTLQEYPNNLFTLFGGVYKMHVNEVVTALCPPRYRGRTTITPLYYPGRMEPVCADLMIVYLHLILPHYMEDGIAPISKMWGGFTTVGTSGVKDAQQNGDDENEDAGDSQFENRDELVRNFIAAIDNDDDQSLNFLHVLLPHYPWEYLPNGKRYTYNKLKDPPGMVDRGIWGTDEWLIRQSLQSHLLQIKFVDKMMGELVDHLKAVGIYDKCLLVITADHGYAIRPGDHSRRLTPSNGGDILPIPLFMKLPNQQLGSISDRNVESVDILPTIANVLGITLPWRTDGISAFDTTAGAARVEKKIFGGPEGDYAQKHYHRYPVNLSARDSAWYRRNHQFNDPGHSNSLSVLKQLEDTYVGKSPSAFPQTEGDFSVWLQNEDIYKNLDSGSGYWPVAVRGKVVGGSGKASRLLAVSVNNTIVTVSRTNIGADGGYLAFIPPQSLNGGNNSIDIYAIKENDNHAGTPILIKPSKKKPYAFVADSRGQETITITGEPELRVMYQGIEGDISGIARYGSYFQIKGWAADVRSGELPSGVMAYCDGRLVYAGGIGNLNRDDIAQRYNNPVLSKSGFVFNLYLADSSSLLRTRYFVTYGTRKSAYELFSPEQRRSVSYSDNYSVHVLGGRTFLETGGRNKNRIEISSSSSITGYLDGLKILDDTLWIKGWAADTAAKTTPSKILFFVDRKLRTSLGLGILRPDIASAFKTRQLLRAGYYFGLPLAQIWNSVNSKSEVAVYALDEGSKRAGKLFAQSQPFEIGTDGKLRIANQQATSQNKQIGWYRLASVVLLADSKSSCLVIDTTLVYPVDEDYPDGYLDDAGSKIGGIYLRGWAADISAGKPFESIAVFKNKEYLASIPIKGERPDISKAYRKAGLLKSGFEAFIPSSAIGPIDATTRFKLFAISRDSQTAVELHYPKQYSGISFK